MEEYEEVILDQAFETPKREIQRAVNFYASLHLLDMSAADIKSNPDLAMDLWTTEHFEGVYKGVPLEIEFAVEGDKLFWLGATNIGGPFGRHEHFVGYIQIDQVKVSAEKPVDVRIVSGWEPFAEFFRGMAEHLTRNLDAIGNGDGWYPGYPNMPETVDDFNDFEVILPTSTFSEIAPTSIEGAKKKAGGDVTPESATDSASRISRQPDPQIDAAKIMGRFTIANGVIIGVFGVIAVIVLFLLPRLLPSINSASLPTPSQTVLPTITPAPTATATPTPIYTVVGLREEDWNLGPVANIGESSFLDGKINVTVFANPGLELFQAPLLIDGRKFSDFEAAVTVQIISDAGCSGRYGFAFRFKDDENLYSAFVEAAGQDQAGIRRKRNDEWTWLGNELGSPIPGNTFERYNPHDLRLKATGRQFDFYVDGDEIAQLEDMSLDEGQFGLIALTLKQADCPFAVRFSEFSLEVFK